MHELLQDRKVTRASQIHRSAMLLCRTEVFLTYDFEVPSYSLIFMPSFVEISYLVQTLKNGDQESHVNRNVTSKD